MFSAFPQLSDGECLFGQDDAEQWPVLILILNFKSDTNGYLLQTKYRPPKTKPVRLVAFVDV